MNLGEGKPFPENINTSLEDSIGQLIKEAKENKKLESDYAKYTNEIKRGRRR